MLRIEMLPAEQGDSLWIEYGDPGQPRRVLIDGGTASSWQDGLKARIEALPEAERHFELLIVTHVDADHIDGALALVSDDTLKASFGDVWFNGWRHLQETGVESLGPVVGERLTDALTGRDIPWNEAFRSHAVCTGQDGEPRRHELDDGLALTVLSPTPQQLADLRPVWKKAVEEAGLDPDRPRAEPEEEKPAAGIERLGAGSLPDVPSLAAKALDEDASETNGSSIAVLLEFDGKGAVLCGDAFPSVLEASVGRLCAERATERLPVDAFKLPHHGSRANVSRELVAALDCPRYLVSSSGARTHHPDEEAVARVLVADQGARSLLFNYRTRFNEVWGRPELRVLHGYEVSYPQGGGAGLAVDL
jgi:beta-lactamase superfamily II metal-dependent hydrolase